MPRHDLLIAGAGPVGLALALALRDSGLSVALADRRPRAAVAADPRVLALAHGSRLTLERLGVWGRFAATPIRRIHVSQRGGFGRTVLQADEYGLPALGYVAAAGALAAALRKAVDDAGIPVMDETEVGPGRALGDHVEVELSAPCAGAASIHHARLLACAEGALNAAPGDMTARDYHQHAIIARVVAEAPHGETAFERFTDEGPIALLPFGDDYALVQVSSPERAAALLNLADEAYLAQLQRQFGARVRLRGVRERQRYPLALRYRRDPVAPRTVWLGNAAQTLHPVAGQGFNLALRDVWALATVLLEHPGDPGGERPLAAYRAGRRLDRGATIHLTDGLVRLFSNGHPVLHHLRGAGLLVLDMCPPLRGLLARHMMFGQRDTAA